MYTENKVVILVVRVSFTRRDAFCFVMRGDIANTEAGVKPRKIDKFPVNGCRFDPLGENSHDEFPTFPRIYTD